MVAENDVNMYNPKMDVGDQYGIAEGYNFPCPVYSRDLPGAKFGREGGQHERTAPAVTSGRRFSCGRTTATSFQGAAVAPDPEHFPNGLESRRPALAFPINYLKVGYFFRHVDHRKLV